MKKSASAVVLFGLVFAFISGCSSGPVIKTQDYAELRSERTFESEMTPVWKAIEKALASYKITDRDPESLDSVELRKTKEISIDTDWIYSRSRDKYHEYRVNGSPRKEYLQTRLRYHVTALKVMGGVQVKVAMDEEVERLKDDGTPDGYDSVEFSDTSRANDLLEKINLELLSGTP
ncbi:MAG: hypothetical protein A2X94_14675 [Bdellovibrionales bacterium GWB1_55_8]|nr:MAG: hypothetical protein A2X94_14675 [Bdellovibrionales bacterium GWB1_55_8]